MKCGMEILQVNLSIFFLQEGILKLNGIYKEFVIKLYFKSSIGDGNFSSV